MNIPGNLKYTREHEWVLVQGKTATIGVTDFAQGELGDVVFVELPEVGKAAVGLKPVGTIEAVKTVADIFAPVTGQVVAVNTELGERPELVNASPYDKGWMVKIEMSKPEELNALLDAEAYRQLVEGGVEA